MTQIYNFIDQEIASDLQKADELIKDSDIMSHNSRVLEEEYITDTKIIHDLPKPREESEQRQENISAMLEKLDNKHQKLVDHFSPGKVGTSTLNSPNMFDSKVSAATDI